MNSQKIKTTTATDETIDYTRHMQTIPQETNPAKLAVMKASLVQALKSRNVHGHISCTYCQDGNILVRVGGCYYGVYNTKTQQFFNGFVGDRG